MRFSVILRVALRSLRRSVLRSFLTMLGMVIGVGAVVTMVSIGDGAKKKVEAEASGPDATKLFIYADIQGKPGMTRFDFLKEALTDEDYLAIRTQRPPKMIAASPLLSGPSGKGTANGRTFNIDLLGIDVEGLFTLNRQLMRGSTFGVQDVHDGAAVCVIPEGLVTLVAEGEDPLGKVISFNGIPLEIIGVVQDNDRNGADTTIFVPYTSLLRRFSRTASTGIVLRVASPPDLLDLRPAVLEILEQRRGERSSPFSAGDIGEGLKYFSDQAETMTVLLASIAGISLFVGGIGIMNIMLVSVSERTREIGLRLAIGTRARDILQQFVVEAVVLSLCGGAIGILVGVGAAYVISQANEWPTFIAGSSVAGAFFVSCAVGVFFGWYPAQRAARLDPIEALRHE